MAAANPVDPVVLVTSLLEQIYAVFESISFANDGQRLLAILTLIALSFHGVKSLLASEPFADTIGGFFAITLTWGVASFFIGGPGGINFTASLVSGFDYLSNRILGGTNYFETLGKMLQTSVNMFEGDTKVADPSWWESLGNFAYLVPTVLMKIFTALLVLIATLFYAAQYIITQFMIKIGVLMAPILVPWIMLKPTEFLFTGWVRFMIVAGMQKVVGSVLLMVTTGIITQANGLSMMHGGDAQANFFIYSVILLIMGIMAMLMMQATGTAHALISGGMGIGRFVAPNKMTPGGATTAASQSMQAAPGKIATGAAATAGAMGGALGAGRAAAANGGGKLATAKAAFAGSSAGVAARKTAAPGGKPTMNPVAAWTAGKDAGAKSASPSQKQSGSTGQTGTRAPVGSSTP